MAVVESQDGSTLGQRIALARAKRGFSQALVAETMNVTPQAISQWEGDKTRPDQSRLKRLAELLEVRLEWLLEGGPETMQVTQRRRVPVIDRIAAGTWGLVTDPYPTGEGSGWLIPDYKKLSDLAFALEISGSSMEPEFHDGDNVIIDPDIRPIPGDFVAAKRDEDDEAVFKKYRPRGYDKNNEPIIELVALNADWPTLIIDADHPGRIIGTMVEHRRYRRR